MNICSISYPPFDWKIFEYWEESERFFAAEETSCMFCGGDHSGAWCMAISEDISEFNQDFSGEGMSKY